MEKKQLFNSSLIGFHPEIFDSYLQISVDIGDNNYESNFTINQTITVDDDFINNYNNTPDYSVGVLAINMTYNGDQTVRHLMSFVKGNEGSYANHIRNGFTYNISINNINTVDKTIDLILISKIDESISLDNYLAKDNTTEYTPTNDYNPATKKYVDDKDNVAKLRLYNGLISLQHTAGKSLINDTCESFADFIAIFDNLQQLDGTKFTNPFTSMTLPTNVNEFLEAFQSFLSTYNVYDAGHLVYPMMGAHASDENIIIIGFYRHIIGPAEIQFGNKNYLNWQANSIFGFGINVTNGNYVQVDDYQNSTLSLDTTLVTDLIERVNNLDLSDYIKKNNTTVYTPTGDYNPATKKYVDDTINKPLLDISSLLQKVRESERNTLVDVTNEIVNLFGSVSAIKTDNSKYRYVTNTGFVNFNNFLNINEFTCSVVYGGVYNENDGLFIYPDKSFLSIYYYNFKINNDDTVVTAYYDIININKDPDKPHQYLSNDGSYKYSYAAGIYFSKDNSQVSNNRYWGNYVIEKKDNNGDCTLVLISDCSELFDEVSTNDLNASNVFGIGGFGILNRITGNSYPYSTPIFIEAIVGVDTKNIKNNRLYTNTWMMLPCVVKYQSKYYIAIRFGNTNDELFIVMGSYLNIIGMSSNLLDSYIYLNCEEGQLYPTGVEVILEGTYFNKENLYYDRNNLLAKPNEDGYMSKEDKTKLDNTPVQKVLTESEYAALGTTPETDNVLYFITPD